MGIRIVVKGASGAGKTTFAETLAQRLGIPHIELDALYHGPNWAPASPAELRARVSAALDDRRGWIVDGNYERLLDNLVVDRADLIIWLDLPLATKLLRLVRRTTRRVLRREELWNGNRETLRNALLDPESLFVWAVRSHFRHRQDWPQALAHRRVFRLRTEAEVAAWLESDALAPHTPSRRR